MKKIYIILILLIAVYESGKSQDLIVTNKNDSINCNITQIRSDYIHFTYKYENEIRNTLLHVSQVKYFQKYFYTKAEVPIDKFGYKENYKKFRLALQGGWSYQLAKVSDNSSAFAKSYENDLKQGYHFGGDITYYKSDNIGFGLKYLNFNAHNSADNVIVTNTNTGQVSIGKIEDNITVQFIGPALYTRLYSANRQVMFSTSLSLGYLGYRDNATVIENYVITGSTIGMVLNLGVDFMVDKDFAVGLGLSYIMGTLTQIDINDGNVTKTVTLSSDEYESLSRLDISVGLRLNL